MEQDMFMERENRKPNMVHQTLLKQLKSLFRSTSQVTVWNLWTSIYVSLLNGIMGGQCRRTEPT